MLISYPILASANVSDDEDQYLKNVLASHVLNDKVRYPVTEVRTPTGPIHRWHGGIHMRGNGEPIRAIADGTVVAYRLAPARETYEGLGDYDTSFVLIHHQTETGENTKVEFYSLYMHLANRQDLYADRYTQLPDWMKQAGPSTAVRKPNKKVWRKDVIGFAGQHYNREAWHFEIFTTDQAFNAFWRDSLFKAEGNGSDDFFGDAHFVIPPGQRFVATHPHANTDHGAHRIDFDSHGHHYDLLRGQDGTNTESLYVSVKLHKGNRIATTWRFDSPKDRFVQVGSALEQPDYEYELYRLATALYPDCPSAGYEWLRFGRVLGPDRTTHNENWQLVRYAPDGVGYVDLAPDRVVKLSDADFPFWQGWDKRIQRQLVNPDDGVCCDESVIELIRANDDASATTLRHLICRHPSEWDASDLAARYAAMRAPDQPLHDDAQWAKFEAHVQKLAFWAEAGLPKRSVWHFHPLQFIRHMRGCGWLSEGEMLQLIPTSAMRLDRKKWISESVSPVAAQRTIERFGVELNRACRKFGIVTSLRLAAFYGNATQETMWFGKLHENNPKAKYWPWDGRGFLQLTWPDNYVKYWQFLGRTIPTGLAVALTAAHKKADHDGHSEPLDDANFKELTAQIIGWRNDVAIEPFDAANSAGAYWAWTEAARFADQAPINERRLQAIEVKVKVGTRIERKPYYRCVSFGQVAATVNFGSPQKDAGRIDKVNGIVARFQSYANALVVLTDAPAFDDAQGRAQKTPEDFEPRRPA